MIAGFLKGEIEGNPDAKVNNVAKIEEGFPGALSFLANPKYEQYIYNTKSTVVLVNKDFIPTAPIEATLIKVNNAYEAFASLLTLVEKSRQRKKGFTRLLLLNHLLLSELMYIWVHIHISVKTAKLETEAVFTLMSILAIVQPSVRIVLLTLV